MRAVIQRVTEGRVTVEGKVIGEIGRGIVLLLGIGKEDTEKDISYLADKIIGLRIFEDQNEKMNLSLKDVGGELLIVSQFTLYGDCRKGKRPGFDKAQNPKEAEIMYNKFVEFCRGYGLKVETGKFQAMMKVDIHNDGPVTFVLDTEK